MSALNLLFYPDPRLRRATKPVTVFDEKLSLLVADLIETMYVHSGVGLAAPQVGVSLRLFVVDVSESRQEPITFINPEFIQKEGSREYEEGCLSVPSYYAKVSRSDLVQIKAQDQHGQWFECHAEGLLATCIQHEYDHLEGALFIDYLSKLKQQRAEKKVMQWKSEHEPANVSV